MTNPGRHIAALLEHRPELAPAESDILALAEAFKRCRIDGGTILTCGNGGSAADADHIACECMKGFLLPRPLPERLVKALLASGVRADLAKRLHGAFRAVSLCSNAALLTAISNDQGADAVFAQQVLGLGRPGDLLLCLSTSGRSPSVLAAAAAAKALGLATALLTGPDPASSPGLFDIVISVPGADAGEIQDLHRPVYHAVCAYAEAILFGNTGI